MSSVSISMELAKSILNKLANMEVSNNKIIDIMQNTGLIQELDKAISESFQKEKKDAELKTG